MVRKGDNCIIKSYDNKEYDVKVTKVDGNRAHIQYKNKENGKCFLRHLMKKTAMKKGGKVNKTEEDTSTDDKCGISKKPERLCKHYQKIGRNKVSFGIHKDKNLTYKQILNMYEEYCRVVVRNNYNVPSDFKEYCCFELL